MFVVSVSKNKIKKSLIIASVVLAISLGAVFVLVGLGNVQQAFTQSGISLVAETENDILSFISELLSIS